VAPDSVSFSLLTVACDSLRRLYSDNDSYNKMYFNCKHIIQLYNIFNLLYNYLTFRLTGGVGGRGGGEDIGGGGGMR
jgi:hypothetical protein